MANRKYKNAVQERKARERSNRLYKSRAQTPFTIRFHNVNDKEVIARLKSVPNRCDYIRKLVLKDIEKEEG